MVREAATVLGEEVDQEVHPLDIRAIEEIASLASADYQTRLEQSLEVKRQGRGGNIQSSRKIGWRVPLRPSLNEQSIHRKSGLRGQSAKRCNGFSRFHSFKYIK